MNEMPSDFNTGLIVDSKGRPRPLIANAIALLRSASEWRGVLAYDSFTRRTMALAAPPWEARSNYRYEARPWASRDDVFSAEWLQHQGVALSVQTVAEAVEAVAQDNTYHPVQDYLDGLAWDNYERLNEWVPTYLGTPNTEYARAVGERMLIGAVARIYEPGVKLDTMVVLEGRQGAGKSSAIKVLSQPWFSDELADLGSKDAAMQLRGTWMVELGELDAMSRSEAEAIKAFLSRSTDRYRPPYGRRVEEVPRSCVLVGSTNSSTYLKDETGARRFWPLATRRIDLDALARDRDQLWAEARRKYRRGKAWWLDSRELNAEAADEQAGRYQQDPWAERIAKYTAPLNSVSVAEVLAHAIEKPTGQWTQADCNRVSRVLRSLDWCRRQVRTGDNREWRYLRPGSEVEP